MAGLINELISTLGEMAVNFEYLLGLAEQKKNTLIKNDVDTLKIITSHENILVGKCQKLERTRTSLVKDISQALAVPERDLSLSKIMDIIKEQNEYAALRDVTERVRGVLEKLREANELNKTLLESSMEYVEYSVNLIRSSFGGDDMFPGIASSGGGVLDMKN